MRDKISIIMPAYNSGLYISDAIESVIQQSYPHWELLIVDNNSSDQTANIIKTYRDLRITYLFENRQGVGFARNLALSKMTGNYFCFLDSDDKFTADSLLSRINIFEANHQLDFVDGAVQYVDQELNNINKKYMPSFTGQPFLQLLKLDNRCIFGNTWMIKRALDTNYSFDTSMTHSEDLFFYLCISENKNYFFTTDTVLHYRQRSDSAMADLKGLENGYIALIKNIRTKLLRPRYQLLMLKIKICKIMFLSFLIDGKDTTSAIKSPFKILFK